MIRLTDKTKRGAYKKQFMVTDANIRNKLGAIEDIEGNIGMWIETISLLLHNGFWIDHYHNGTLYHMQMPLLQSTYDSRRLNPVKLQLIYHKDNEWHTVELEEYGKTYWLKEDKSI